MPQEVRDLFEGHDGRKVFDEVAAAIDQPAIGAVNLADRSLGGHHTFQPRAELRHDS